jgi:hypothetical protein
LTKLGSTRFAVELVYIPYLAFAVETSASVVVPLFASVAADPLLAISHFDLRVRRLARGANEIRLCILLGFGAPPGFGGRWCCASKRLEWDRLSAHSVRRHISSR